MTKPPANGKRVLVVDDGMTTRLYYRDVLETAGFAVEEAVNGVEGLERALMGAFDLLIVDVNMPKMDGYEMIAQVRVDPALHEIPIITISTEAGERDADRAYSAGANLYMVKPAEPLQLTETAQMLTGVETVR
ncbi:response regulator [Sphingomonas sp. 8AM]|uniref:response regulator n=1 Tax=Sphingomonas sp. 8AM TaxID=2653170 RepID=UPI0012F1BBD6|nr:response regulator [Sphingomonas sp. 8AM]VXC32028.1 Chemotaxis protein CheY [Sphingomonas sp. 8AM]